MVLRGISSSSYSGSEESGCWLEECVGIFEAGRAEGSLEGSLLESGLDDMVYA